MNPAAPVIRMFIRIREYFSVCAKKVATIDTIRYILNFRGDSIGDNNVCFLLELVEAVDHAGTEKVRILENRFVDYDLNALCFYPLHYPLDGRSAEII